MEHFTSESDASVQTRSTELKEQNVIWLTCASRDVRPCHRLLTACNLAAELWHLDGNTGEQTLCLEADSMRSETQKLITREDKVQWTICSYKSDKLSEKWQHRKFITLIPCSCSPPVTVQPIHNDPRLRITAWNAVSVFSAAKKQLLTLYPTDGRWLKIVPG